MRLTRVVPALVLTAAMLAACKSPRENTAIESVGVDSLTAVRQELLDEVIASTTFMNDIHKQLEKARVLTIASVKTVDTPSDLGQLNEQRKQVLGGITRLVARLDSVQTRLTYARGQVAQLTRKDSALVAQVAEYQKSMSDLQAAAETQRAELQTIVDQQKTQIVALASKVDTLDRTRVALLDTVGRLTAEKNAAYYVVGTREELIKKGILVAEGQKRFLVLGSRNIVPARKLDPANFTKIDRVSNRTIVLPEGEYQILSRQNPEFATASSTKPGKITGPLTIEQPEQFWETSPFLIIVKG
jgi:phage shock protein A